MNITERKETLHNIMDFGVKFKIFREVFRNYHGLQEAKCNDSNKARHLLRNPQMCDSSNKEYISGNSLAWEHLGEWFVEESCSTRAMNLPSKLSCRPYLGSHASNSVDLYINLSHRQGD